MPDLRFLIYAAFLLCIFLYGLVHWQYLKVPYQMLVVLIAFTLFGEAYGRVLVAQNGGAQPFYHFYAVVEYAFLALIYYQVALRQYTWARLWLGFSIAGFTSFSVINSFYIQGLKSFPSYAVMIAGLLYAFMSMSSLVAMVRFPDERPLHWQPAFWFNIGTLVFYLLSFFAFGFSTQSQVPGTITNLLWDFVYVGNWALYICYAIALYLNIRSSKRGWITMA